MSFYPSIRVNQAVQLSEITLHFEPLDLPTEEYSFYGVPVEFDGIVWSIYSTDNDDQDGATLDDIGVYYGDTLNELYSMLSEEDKHTLFTAMH